VSKNTDPRLALASLGARAVYATLRRLRDENDTVHAVQGHTIADTVAAVLSTREREITALLNEMTLLGLVVTTPQKAVLLPREGTRARTAAGTPKVALTSAERVAKHRAKKSGSVTGNVTCNVTSGVTPIVTESDSSVTNSADTSKNVGSNACNDTVTSAVTSTVTTVTNHGGGSSPLPQVSSPSSPSPTPSSSSSPSSFPETPSTPPSTAGARETQPSGQPGLPGVEGGTETAKPDEAPKAKPKRPAKPKPEPAPDPVPDEGTAARRVYDLVRADAGLVAIVRGPGAWSQRITIDGAFPGLSAEQVIAGVLAAARWNAANPGRWKTELGVEAWLNKNSRDAMATPRPAAPSPTPRVSGRVPVPRDPVPRDPEERRAAFVRAMSRYEAQ